MRYTEKDLKTKYANFTEYMSSIMELLILSPFRLVNEISKKVVYLEKNRIEKVLLVADGIALLIIVLECVMSNFFGGIELLSGKFPIAFQALTPITITLIYGFIKNYDFSMVSQFSEILNHSADKNSEENDEEYSKNNKEEMDKDYPEDFDLPEDLEEDLNKSFTEDFGENISDEDFSQANTFNPMQLDGFNEEDLENLQKANAAQNFSDIMQGIGIDDDLEDEDSIDVEMDTGDMDLSGYDCAGENPKHFINPDLVGNQDVLNYQNRHGSTVSKLQKRDKAITHNSLFDERELQMIQKLCDVAEEESKYIGDDVIQIVMNNQAFDDFSQVETFMKNDNVDWLQPV